MANNLYRTFGNTANPYAQMIDEISKFGQSLKGNPQQMVQNLLHSGQMSQHEFNRLTQIAQQIMPFMANH